MSPKKTSMQAAVPLIDNRLLPKPLQVALGEPCSITVSITGLPAPIVRWQIGRKRVKESSKYQMRTDGELQHTLVIARATDDLDQGVWVVASNEHGEDCCQIEVTTHSEVSRKSSMRGLLRKKKTRRKLGQTQSVTSLDAWSSDQKATIVVNRPPSVDDVTSVSGDAGTTTTPSVLNQSLDAGSVVVVVGRRKKRRQAGQPTRFSSTDAIYAATQNPHRLSLHGSPNTVAVRNQNAEDTPDVVGDGGTVHVEEPTKKKKGLRKKGSGSRSSLASAGSELAKDRDVADEENVFGESVNQRKTRREDVKKTRKTSKTEAPPVTVDAGENRRAKEDGQEMWELFGVKLNLLCKQLLLRGDEFAKDPGGGTFQKMDHRMTDQSVLSVEFQEQKIADGQDRDSQEKLQPTPITNLDDLEQSEEEKREDVKIKGNSNQSSVNTTDSVLSYDNNQQLIEKGYFEEEIEPIKVKSPVRNLSDLEQSKEKEEEKKGDVKIQGNSNQSSLNTINSMLTKNQQLIEKGNSKDEIKPIKVKSLVKNLEEKIKDNSNQTSVNMTDSVLSNEKNQQLIDKGHSEKETKPIKVNNDNAIEDEKVVKQTPEDAKKSTDLYYTMPIGGPKSAGYTVTPETKAMAKVTGMKPGEENKMVDSTKSNYNQPNQMEFRSGSLNHKPSPEKESTENTNKLTEKPPHGKKKPPFIDDDRTDGNTQTIAKSSELQKNIPEKQLTSTKNISEHIANTNRVLAPDGQSKVTVREGTREETVTTPSMAVASGHSRPLHSEVKADKNIAEPGMITRLPSLLAMNRPAEKPEQKQVLSNTENKDPRSAEIKSKDSTGGKETRVESEQDQTTRIEPGIKPESNVPVVLTTYITHRSKKTQPEIDEKPTASVTHNNSISNSTFPSTTATPASKEPPSTDISGRNASASLPPPSPAPRRSMKVSEAPGKSSVGESAGTAPKRVRSQSAERPTLVLVDIDIDAKESDCRRAGRTSPPTPKARKSLLASNLHRSRSSELHSTGGNQSDTKDDFCESSQRPVPHPRYRSSLKPARSEEFLAGRSDPTGKVIPLQRGFLRGSKSVESLRSASDSFTSKMGRRTLSKEWQVVTVTTTEEILVIDQSKAVTAETEKKREEAKEDDEKEKQISNDSVTDGKAVKVESKKVAPSDAKDEPRQTTKLTIKELRDQFLGINDERTTGSEDLKPNTQKVHSKTATEEPKLQSKIDNVEQAVDVSIKELPKDIPKVVPGFEISDESLKNKPNKVDTIHVEEKATKINMGLKSENNKTQPSQEPENVTYISNAIIYLKSPVTLVGEADRSNHRLEVDAGRPRLISQDMCTQTEEDDIPKETETCTSVKADDEATADKDLNQTETENVCSAVFYEYSELLSYYLDTGDEIKAETQNSEMELLQLQSKAPVTAAVTESFDRIILSPQSLYSEEIDADNADPKFPGLVTFRSSRSTSADEMDIKPLIVLSPKERSMIEEMFQNNDFQPTDNPQFITFEDEPRVRNNVTISQGSAHNKFPENRPIISVETDVDDILTVVDHHPKESSVDDVEVEIQEHVSDSLQQAEEISDIAQSGATSRNENDASDEDSHPSSSLSAPSCDTVIFKANKSDEAVEQKTSKKLLNSKPTHSLRAQQRADDTDEDDVLELELDSASKTDETKNTSKLNLTHDDDKKVHRDDDEVLLGAVGGDPPQEDRTKDNQERRSQQPEPYRSQHRYEELDEKVYMHTALSRLGSVLFLLLAAIIFHFLNRMAGDELE